MIHGALVALVGITHVTARTSLIPVPTFHIGPRLPRWRPRPIPGSLEELAAALVAR